MSYVTLMNDSRKYLTGCLNGRGFKSGDGYGIVYENRDMMTEGYCTIDHGGLRWYMNKLKLELPYDYSVVLLNYYKDVMRRYE